MYFFPLLFRLSKLVQIGESRWIIEYSQFLTRCTLNVFVSFLCLTLLVQYIKLLMEKYVSTQFDQSFSNILVNYFYCAKVSQFCNHLNINSNKSTMFIMILNYFQSTFFYLCQKLDHFFIAFLTTFYVYFTMLSFVTTCDWLQSIDSYFPLVSLISKHSKD